MVLGLGIGAEYNYEAIRWSPHNVPPVGSLELWLNHDDGQTVVSEQVSEWKDKSGNNRHATQGAAGDRATFDNGALDFESGEGDHYDLGSQVEIEEEDGFHIHIVCEVESTMTIFGLNNIDHMLEFRAGGDNVRIRLGGTTTEIIPDSANNFHQTAGKFLLSLVRYLPLPPSSKFSNPYKLHKLFIIICSKSSSILCDLATNIIQSL